MDQLNMYNHKSTPTGIGRASWNQGRKQPDNFQRRRRREERKSVCDVRPGKHWAWHQHSSDHPDCCSSLGQLYMSKLQQVVVPVSTSLTHNLPVYCLVFLIKTLSTGSFCQQCQSTGEPPWCMG